MQRLVHVEEYVIMLSAGSGGSVQEQFRLGRLMDRTVVSGTIDGGSIPSRAAANAVKRGQDKRDKCLFHV